MCRLRIEVPDGLIVDQTTKFHYHDVSDGDEEIELFNVQEVKNAVKSKKKKVLSTKAVPSTSNAKVGVTTRSMDTQSTVHTHHV